MIDIPFYYMPLKILSEIKMLDDFVFIIKEAPANRNGLRELFWNFMKSLRLSALDFL